MHNYASQRPLHNAPIFRLLLKVAVKGTHQCDFLICLRGRLVPNHPLACAHVVGQRTACAAPARPQRFGLWLITLVISCPFFNLEM